MKYIKWLTLLILIIIIGILVYFRSQRKEDIFYPLPNRYPTSIPKISSDNIPCRSNEKKYFSVSQALSEPQNVCNLTISNDIDINKLSQTGGQFSQIKILTLKTVSDIKIPQMPSLLTLHILDIGEKDEDEEGNTAVRSAPDSKASIKSEEESEGTSIPSAIGKLSNLTMLYITITNIKKLPPEIGDLRQLQKLFLTGNPDLTTIPVSVAKLENLTNILLSKNPRLNIPDSLFSHQTLEHITVADGKLTGIPKTILQLKNLKYLSLSHVRLNKIPGQIGNLSSLQTLDLTNNEIKNFPDIHNLINLEELNLGNNQLSDLPPGTEKLKNLKALRLSNNNIDDSKTQKIQELKNLETLDLGSNLITKIPPGIEKLKNLKYLRLSGNNIDHLQTNNLKTLLPDTNIVY